MDLEAVTWSFLPTTWLCVRRRLENKGSYGWCGRRIAKSIDPRARELVAERGAFVPMELAEGLEAVGGGPVELELEWNVSSRAAVLRDLRRQIRRLYTKLGGLNVLAFCMRLLSSSGRTGAAAAVWRFLDRAIAGREDQTIRAFGPAMRALAEEGRRLIGVEAQESGRAT